MLNSEQLSATVDLAQKAGLILKSLFKTGLVPIKKQDGSSATFADQESERIIRQGLAGILPGMPFVGEESVELGDVPDIGRGNFWCVDPLDGTRDFIEGNDGFAVFIGLILDGAPQLGVIHQPMRGITYAGFVGGGAFRLDQDSKTDLAPLAVAEGVSCIIVEPSYEDRAPMQKFLRAFPDAQKIHAEDPLRLMALAEGRGDVCPIFNGSYEWDMAASHAILRSLGAELYDATKRPLSYGKPRFKNAHQVACIPGLLGQLPEF